MRRELENEVLVYAFEKNKAAEVRARLYSFGGHRLADVRIFAPSREDKAIKVPTRTLEPERHGRHLFAPVRQSASG